MPLNLTVLKSNTVSSGLRVKTETRALKEPTYTLSLDRNIHPLSTHVHHSVGAIYRHKSEDLKNFISTHLIAFVGMSFVKKSHLDTFTSLVPSTCSRS